MRNKFKCLLLISIPDYNVSILVQCILVNVFKLDFLTPSTCNSCLYVLNNRLPRLARYLQAVFIVSNFLEDLINLKLET